MKFLTDQDVYAVTVRFLVSFGHDIVTASKLGLAQAPDHALLEASQAQGRILVTRDRDFGGIVFFQGAPAGVIYLRILPSTLNAVHAELEDRKRVIDSLREYMTAELRNAIQELLVKDRSWNSTEK
jgi:predicted nuclease of predicted toxin-antitoxin system